MYPCPDPRNNSRLLSHTPPRADKAAAGIVQRSTVGRIAPARRCARTPGSATNRFTIIAAAW